MSDTTKYQVKSQCVIARRPGEPEEPGPKFEHFYHGAILPDDMDREQLEMLLESGEVVEAGEPLDDVVADTGPADWGDGGDDEAGGYDPSKHKIDEVLAHVGEDAVYAADVLDAEKAGKNRKGLVDQLQALIDADDQSDE